MRTAAAAMPLLAAHAFVAHALVARPLAAQRTPARAVGAVRGPVQWGLAVAGGGGYESNVRFDGISDDGDVVRRLRAEGNGSLRTLRTRVALVVAGDATSYRLLRDLDRVTYQGGVDATHIATPRLVLQGGASARSSVSSDVAQSGGAADAVALPLARLARSQSLAGAGSAVYRLTPRTTGVAGASVTRIRYDDATLQGGATSTADAAVTRRLTPNATLGAQYRLERTTLGDASFTGQTVTTDWAAPLGRLALRLRGGGTLYTGDGADGTPRLTSTVRPIGDGSATVARGRLTLSVAAARTVGATFGIGRVLSTDHVGVAVERAGRGTVLRLTADRGWSADPADPALRLSATTASADVRQAIGGTGVWLALGGFLRARSTGGLATDPRARGAIANHGVALTLGTLLGS